MRLSVRRGGTTYRDLTIFIRQMTEHVEVDSICAFVKENLDEMRRTDGNYRNLTDKLH